MYQSKSSYFLLFFILITFAKTTQKDLNLQPSDSRISIQLYYQSLCPYCHNFIDQVLRQVLQIPDIWNIAHFKLIPFGNADIIKNGRQYYFTCQHGEPQCQGNIIQNCALDLYDNQKYALPFILCLEKTQKNWNADGKKCAAQNNMDWNRIKNCTNSFQGRQSQYFSGLATKYVGVKKVPYLLVNGVNDRKIISDIYDNFLKVLCQLYAGESTIESCKLFMN